MQNASRGRRLAHIQQRVGVLSQRPAGQEYMALNGSLIQRVLHTGGDTLGRVCGDPQRACDLIRRQKADAVDLFGQPIRILLHNFNGAVAVTLVDLRGQAGG